MFADGSPQLREKCAELERYNGWTNRETWAAHLWLSSDEGLYHSACDIVASAASEHDEADALRSWVVDELFDPEWIASSEMLRMMRDEIGSEWRVNWPEVAAAFREEV